MMKTPKNPSTISIAILLTLFVVIFVFFLYTFLHEAGHALAGWLFGQSLTEFDVSFWDLSAHVGLTGAELTHTQLAIRSMAGTLLPLVVWVAFISLVPRRGNFILEELKLLASMLVINTLLAWIFLPILFMLGKAPPDDVTSFLIYSQMPPLLLSFMASILYAGGWILFLSKIGGLRNEFLMFKTVDFSLVDSGTRMTLAIMAAVMMVCAVVVFALNNLAAKHSSDRYAPPQDFVLAAQIDLSSRPYTSETIAEFTLDQASYADVFVTIRNINTRFFDLSVTRPDGTSDIVLHGEGYKASQDGGLWEKSLPAGTYQLVLTSAQSPGRVSVYLKTNQP